jgi:hypothetical protein
MSYAALCDHLKDLSLDYLIAWPDVNFTPPKSGKFLEVLAFNNPTQTISMDNSGVQHETGLFRVNVYWPIGQGRTAPLVVADSIKDHFAKGTSLADGARIDQAPWVGSSLRSEAGPFKGHYTITPVNIPWAK